MSDNKTLLEFDLRLSDIARGDESTSSARPSVPTVKQPWPGPESSHLMSPVTAKGPENPVG